MPPPLARCSPVPALNTVARVASAQAASGGLVGFQPVPVSSADTVVVPKGYKVQVLVPWGTPISGAMPAFAASNSGADQAQQMGMHHDGMHFFPDRGQCDRRVAGHEP
ncbi:alkaline phosphatase PhoX [Oceanibaculum nanhaiense]|uniref:alkaline phosphatase PhoX n=1 Tax=Oceanibaculum nanhaiense TaxID=1909734 RepID=UPI003D2A2D53